MPKRGMNKDKLSVDQHAKTHDVRREAHTNPKGPEPPGEDFAADLAPQTSGQHAGHTMEELEDVYFGADFDRDRFFQGGREVLDAIAAFWDGLDGDRRNRIYL